jgi:hypothetical protein
MEEALQALKKLNVFAQMLPKPTGNAMFSKARPDAGHTLLIAAVGLRLVAITPHLEQGDHLRFRQLSAMLLIVSWLLAMALSFAHVRIALWALALNFAASRAAALH